MSKIIALEGLSCSGKTSFFNKFILENDNFYCIPELFIDEEKNTPIVLRKKYSDAELDKKESIGKISKNIICDRSFLSTLAFSYAKYMYTGNKEDYEYNLDFFKKNRSKIIIPDYIVVFNISPQKSIERRKKVIRKDKLKFWNEIDFLKYFSDYYFSNEINLIMSKEKIIFINILEKNMEDIYTIVKKIIIDISMI